MPSDLTDEQIQRLVDDGISPGDCRPDSFDNTMSAGCLRCGLLLMQRAVRQLQREKKELEDFQWMRSKHPCRSGCGRYVDVKHFDCAEQCHSARLLKP